MRLPVVDCEHWTAVKSHVGTCARQPECPAKPNPNGPFFRPDAGACSKVCKAHKPVKSRARKVQRRPRATARAAVSFAVAMATAKRVTLDVVKQRAEVCDGCDQVREDPKDGAWCARCGCPMSADRRRIQNLAAVEENVPNAPGYNPLLPRWGCKLEGRFDAARRWTGKGWDPAWNRRAGR